MVVGSLFFDFFLFFEEVLSDLIGGIYEWK